MCPQIKAAYSLYTFQWADIKYGCTLSQKIAARPRIVLNRLIVSDMAKTRVTPRAKYPDQTQQFIKDVHDALDKFEEHVHFPDAEVRRMRTVYY